MKLPVILIASAAAPTALPECLQNFYPSTAATLPWAPGAGKQPTYAYGLVKAEEDDNEMVASMFFS